MSDIGNNTGNPFIVTCPIFRGNSSFISDVGSKSTVTRHCPYAHPADSGIISVLEKPAIREAFGTAVNTLSDLNYGQIIASGLPVNEESFPEINDIVDHCVKVLGINKPYVVISNSIGINAFTIGDDQKPAIVLGSMLVRVMSTEKLTFIIGHECGHIAMGHVIYHTVVNTTALLSESLPLVGPLVASTSVVALAAWSRRSEITADRAGLLCCESIDTAKEAFVQLEAGFIETDKIDFDTYVDHSRRYRSGSLLRRIGEFTQLHPLLPKRMEALELFTHSCCYYRCMGLHNPKNAISDECMEKAVEKILSVVRG